MEKSERVRNEVIYRKEITTDEPDAHAELILKIEGVPDEKVERLRGKFLALYKDVEETVRKELTDKAKRQPAEKEVLAYKDGRPYFEKV